MGCLAADDSNQATATTGHSLCTPWHLIMTSLSLQPEEGKA